MNTSTTISDAEKLYYEIDEMARDADSYDFGLPMTNGKQEIIQRIQQSFDAITNDLKEELRLMTIERDNYKDVARKARATLKRKERSLRKILEQL